MKDVKL